MDVNAITQVIASLGFPCAVCLVCFWYINKIVDQHKEESAAFIKAIENNTIAIKELAAKLSERAE